MNALEKYLMTKESSPFMDAGKSLFQNARVGAEEAIGSAGAGLAVAGLGAAAMKIYKAVRKKSDFTGMMDHNPDLAEYQSSNPKMFNAHYNSFRALNPQFAEDPIISGTYMRQMSMNPQTAGHVLVESLENRGKAMPSRSQLTTTGRGEDRGASYRFNF